ncbi:MAG TPA: response regulator [Actinomycetota bacterium]|jgi:DNA-binding response OmpR family regulator|nr:response regulator [Actinomycetota bacterium]
MRTLLIADDESGIRSLVRMTLQRKQYEILEASDGEEALALARKHHPELVLLDVMMPGLSGFDVCRALKDDPATADATVVMLTAKAQDGDRAEGIAAGADDYFTKPFSPIALLRKIDDVYGEE